MWYRKYIGGERCPSWTRGGRPRRAASSLRLYLAVTVTKPGAAMAALPGISAEIVDNEGETRR